MGDDHNDQGVIAIRSDQLSILSLEDEPVIADRIARLCSEILGDRIALYHNCATVGEALQEADRGIYDIFLLDLNLHGEDGFGLLQQSASFAAQTIVISAYKDRAAEAFDFGVTDFVSKPFDKERLEQALDRFDNWPRPDQHPKFLAFRSPGKTHVVAISEVIYIAGADQYSEVHLSNGTSRLHDKSLGQFEQLLPDGYERIHKSYIVHLDQIDRLEMKEGSRYFAMLKTGERLPVGRTRYNTLKQRYL